MKKVNHIAIAVKDIEKSNSLFAKIFGKPNYKQEIVEDESVVASFYQIGDMKVELVSPTKENTTVASFIKKKGEGFHHICFEVESVSEEISRLRSEGFRILEPEIRKGAEGKLISFLHPKDTNGFLIELSQSVI